MCNLQAIAFGFTAPVGKRVQQTHVATELIILKNVIWICSMPTEYFLAP